MKKLSKKQISKRILKVTNITEQKTDFELNKKRIFKWKITLQNTKFTMEIYS